MANPHGHVTHGLYHNPIYHVWASMRQRCRNPNCKTYKWYGAKGIKVCDEWNELVSFSDWAIANGYSKGLTLDRIDPDGDYEPINCRWITIAEQQRNRSNNRIITLGEETHTLSEWSRLLGVQEMTIIKRLQRGLSLEQAFSNIDYRRKNIEVS